MKANGKIGCIVVTYNRLSLLKECIKGIESQTIQPYKVYIIDNKSTDGTDEFLDGSYSNNALFHIKHLQENIGGAGGFKCGMELALRDGCDWLWLMDDDTIPYPNALLHLQRATTLTSNIGFCCSKVLWTDGSVHWMNRPDITIRRHYRYPPFFNDFSTEDCPAFRSSFASFVSVLISSKAVRKVGYPYKEFFIWADDFEFTERIVKSGFIGLYVDNSIVIHKTQNNYAPDLKTAPVNTAWKFYYQIRNTLFYKRINKKKKGIAFVISSLNYYRKCVRKLRKRPKAERDVFRKYLWKGCMAGLKFNPSIEYPNETKQNLLE